MAKRETAAERYDRNRLEAALKEKDAQIASMEDRLEATFDDARAAKKELEESKEKWATEKCDLKARIKQLEEDVKHEKRRASQALDVAANTSDAAGGIGRLLNRIVDNDVMETLRLASHKQREEARKRLRRSPE